MAFWVVGGGPLDGNNSSVNASSPYLESGKRRVCHADGIDHFYEAPKRPRLDRFGQFIRPCHDYEDRHAGITPLHDSVQVKNLAFLVIREASPTPEPPSGAGTCGMERTASGLSISSDTTQHACFEEEDDEMLSDLAAAGLVRNHVAGFRRRYPDSKHGRILKALINPKSREADFPLDNDALRSIFIAANELFFANRLSRRVEWDWSHPTSAQYQSHIVGTTAVRPSTRLGGYETLIVLSSPILKDTKYNRRLLISTFLHEMIHSFLFVTCGLKARHCGGHTEGFRQIAEIIDSWVGKEHLHLSRMEADLERFRGDDYSMYDSNQRIISSRVAWESEDYPPEPRRRHYDYSSQEWQWYGHEGFPAPGQPGVDHSYVY
ncbi:hypothetical protein B0I35DRAFT_477791 [Stachybotrys elegans]|uniref:SprT-like domain-containing protein n=1 Tax=Stachybotrys elegans TaxID=80388 RepID=A0A8K0WTL3_9HYPO|nr:hypothetical protein B0I35DRAFT_477791 [Stachybotrys elegans]